MSQQALSRRQQDCFNALSRLHKEKGHAPSYRELASELGLGSTNAVSELLKQLKRKGWVNWEKGKARAIVITQPKENA